MVSFSFFINSFKSPIHSALYMGTLRVVNKLWTTSLEKTCISHKHWWAMATTSYLMEHHLNWVTQGIWPSLSREPDRASTSAYRRKQRIKQVHHRTLQCSQRLNWMKGLTREKWLTPALVLCNHCSAFSLLCNSFNLTLTHSFSLCLMTHQTSHPISPPLHAYVQVPSHYFCTQWAILIISHCLIA